MELVLSTGLLHIITGAAEALLRASFHPFLEIQIYQTVVASGNFVYSCL